MNNPLELRTRLQYGVAEVGASLSFVTISIFYLFFLINVAGLRPGLAGTVLLLGRGFDAVTDPLMGVLSDRTRSRWGRRMPFIRFGFVPLSASFALLWLTPFTTDVHAFMYALASFTVFTLLYTLVQMPYLALTPELAPEYDARTSLSSYRVAFAVFASLLAAALPPVLISINAAGQQPMLNASGWWLMGVSFAVIMSVAYALMAFSIHEPTQRTPANTRPLKLRKNYSSALRIFGYREILGIYMLITLGLGVLQSSLPFYLNSNLRLGTSQQTLMQGLLFSMSIVALPLWTYLSRQKGKRFACAAGLLVISISLVLLVQTAPAGRVSFSLILLTLSTGVGLSAITLLPWAMLPDVIEFDQLHNKQKREGLIYALFTFAQKIMIALSAFITGQTLEFVGYQQGVVQSGVALTGVRVLMGPVTAGVFVVTLLLVWRYPVTKARHAAVMARLKP